MGTQADTCHSSLPHTPVRFSLPPLPRGSQVSRPWPGLAHSRHSVVVESDPGPPANQRQLSWPVDQSEAGTVLPTGSVRPGLACRVGTSERPGPPGVSQYQARHNTGRLSPISHHISQEISIISTHADNTAAGSVNSEPRNWKYIKKSVETVSGDG